MIHYWFVFRDLLHLVWFILPLVLAYAAGGATEHEENVAVGSWLTTAAVFIQFILVLGYLEGWNVK